MFRIRLVLLFLAGSVALWFSAKSASDLFTFWRLDGQGIAHVQTWKVQELASSKFVLMGCYVFEVEGKQYRGESLLTKPSYLNLPTAEGMIKKKSSRAEVWYAKKNPSLSSLERLFPLGDCLRAVAALGLFLYFYFLRGYLQKLES